MVPEHRAPVRDVAAGAGDGARRIVARMLAATIDGKTVGGCILDVARGLYARGLGVVQTLPRDASLPRLYCS